MPWLIPQSIAPAADAYLQRFIAELAEQLDDPSQDRNHVVRETLAQLLHGRSYARLEAESPLAALALDPRHIILEAEHYIATDQARFQRVKPLLWLWKCLDSSPLGQSLASGIPLRRMLAARIFAKTGRNLKIFQNVEVSVGYNIEVGDDVVIHRNVLIDDIGGVKIGDGASISDYANIYSHTHDIRYAEDVTLKETVIGRGVRVAYHATVLAGSILSDDSMLGAFALATRDIEPHVVSIGIPAKPRIWKERSGDPEFANLAVDSRYYPRRLDLRANPDYRSPEEQAIIDAEHARSSTTEEADSEAGQPRNAEPCEC